MCQEHYRQVGIGVVSKAENDWREVQQPQVAMHHNNATFSNNDRYISSLLQLLQLLCTLLSSVTSYVAASFDVPFNDA